MIEYNRSYGQEEKDSPSPDVRRSSSWSDERRSANISESSAVEDRQTRSKKERGRVISEITEESRFVVSKSNCL